MGRTLGYDHAVRALGGDATQAQRIVDTLVGAGMLALVGPFRDVLGWFDAKAELSRVTEHLITGLAQRRGSLTRHERSEQLRAAQVIVAAAAFFEVVDEAELPLDVRSLRLTATEQQALAERVTRETLRPPVPGPAESHEEFRERLAEFYRRLGGAMMLSGAGLAVWERFGDGVLDEMRLAVTGIAEPAVVRFEGMLGRLAADFPEVAFWTNVREQAAVRARLRDVRTGLSALAEALDAIAVGRAPDERRAGLARAYAAALDRPIAATGEVPAGLSLPTLRAAFVPQAYRSAEAAVHTPLSDEDWWQHQPVRDDLLAFLTTRLTSPEAAAAPLLILGQPGSGKSVLARVLGARLPPEAFLPVLVALRSVHAASDVQEQIEQAIRADTGERVEWPALARSAGDALPVVVLDGFDELLQATGVSQTDYLLGVAAFQRREADQGRPVAVVVTSRTSVADRAQTAEGSVAIRLEPFDRPRVQAWLDTWNSVNAGHFAGGAATELALDTVLRYPDLAGQPLLLLMLAIYDAEGNGLRSAGSLRPDQLYERLLHRFARREVEKRGAGLPLAERDRLTELELRKLSVVAFAMFNRGAQWVTEDELDADLRALPGLAGPAPAVAARGGLRAPARAAELALGSFFFVHRARATRDDNTLSAYEFLHATFGEFLVARLIHGVLHDMGVRERVTAFATGAAAEDGLLHALLSFAPLAGRRQIIAFAHGMTSDLTPDDRAARIDLLVPLFDAAQRPRIANAYDAYTPRHLTVPARVAAYTANLLVLALCADGVTAARLLGTSAADDPHGDRTVGGWHELALLWHSQGNASGWAGLIDHVQVHRIRRDGWRDIALELSLDHVPTAPPVDMTWVLNVERPAEAVSEDRVNWIFADTGMETVPREAHFTCDSSNDAQQHAIEPLYRTGLATGGDRVYLPRGGAPVNVLGAFLSLSHDHHLSASERESLYRYAAGWSRTVPGGDELLLRCLELDADVDLTLLADLVQALAERGTGLRGGVPLLRCVTAHLHPDRDRAACERLAACLVVFVLDREDWTDLHADAAIRIAELDLGRIVITAERAQELLDAYAARRPDFVERVRILVPDSSRSSPA